MPNNNNSNFTGSGRGGQGGGSRGKGGLRGQGAGPGGFCVCPGCGARLEHQPGIPCTEVKCPKCGLPMIRGN
jgi:hypothetical protein